MRIYTFIEKCVQTVIFLSFVYSLVLLDTNDAGPDVYENIIGAMLGMTTATMLPVYFFYYIAGFCETLRNPLFAEFLKRSGKEAVSFMFGPNLYLKDVFSWLAPASLWLIVLNDETPHSLSLLSFIFYPFISVFAYAQAQTENAAGEQPEDTEDRTFFSKRTWQNLSEKRTDSDLSDAKREQCLAAEKLKETAEHIATYIPLIENKSLAENIKTISAAIHRIADFAASKKSKKEIRECLDNALFYAEEFYNMLVSYDKIANSSLRIKESDRLMQSIESFAEDLSSALVKMLETAISPDLLESRSRIAALRKEIHMKGLHTG